MPNNELLLKERAEAFKGLKSLVYGGGNIGNDGKDDGGHRSLHGNLLFDHWQTIERALTAPDQTETIRALVEALDFLLFSLHDFEKWNEVALPNNAIDIAKKAMRSACKR